MRTTIEHGRTMVSGYLWPADAAEHASDLVVLDTPRLTAAITSCALGPTPVAVIEDPNGSTVTRSGDAPREPAATHLVGLLTHGAGHLSTDAGTVELTPGRMMIYSGDAPFVLRFTEAHRYVVAQVSDALLPAGTREMDLVATDAHASDVPTARIAAGLLGSLSHVDLLAPPVRTALGDALLELLRDTVDDLCGIHHPRSLLDEIHEWIEQRLSDGDLTPTRIAAAHFISVRYLHQLFRLTGTTVGEHVRARRLERVKSDLRDPRSSALSVAAIGARWGVADPNLLNRQFRARVGTTPARWRQQMAATG